MMANGAEPGRVSLLESLLMGGQFMGRHRRAKLNKINFPKFSSLMRSTWQDQQELNCCQMGWAF